jgi:hypothetical protein
MKASARRECHGSGTGRGPVHLDEHEPALGERRPAQRPHDREARVGAGVIREGLDLRAQRGFGLPVTPETGQHVATHELEPRHRAEARAPVAHPFDELERLFRPAAS